MASSRDPQHRPPLCRGSVRDRRARRTRSRPGWPPRSAAAAADRRRSRCACSPNPARPRRVTPHSKCGGVAGGDDAAAGATQPARALLRPARPHRAAAARSRASSGASTTSARASSRRPSTSAAPLDDAEVEPRSAQRLEQMTGGRVELSLQVDPEPAGRRPGPPRRPTHRRQRPRSPRTAAHRLATGAI